MTISRDLNVSSPQFRAFRRRRLVVNLPAGRSYDESAEVYSWSQDTFVNASSLSVQEIVLHLRIAFEAGLCYQLAVCDNVQQSIMPLQLLQWYKVCILFHDLLLRSYLYHCVWSVITAHNLTPEKRYNNYSPHPLIPSSCLRNNIQLITGISPCCGCL